jgi:hypothetical protein
VKKKRPSRAGYGNYYRDKTCRHCARPLSQHVHYADLCPQSRATLQRLARQNLSGAVLRATFVRQIATEPG